MNSFRGNAGKAIFEKLKSKGVQSPNVNETEHVDDSKHIGGNYLPTDDLKQIGLKQSDNFLSVESIASTIFHKYSSYFAAGSVLIDFKINDKHVYVSKFHLAEQSKMNGEIKMEKRNFIECAADSSFEAVKQFANYVNFGSFEHSDSYMGEMWKLANEFNVWKLQKIFSDFVLDQMQSIDNQKPQFAAVNVSPIADKTLISSDELMDKLMKKLENCNSIGIRYMKRTKEFKAYQIAMFNPKLPYCSNCNLNGHKIAECPDVACSYCGKCGHIRDQCPDMLKKYECMCNGRGAGNRAYHPSYLCYLICCDQCGFFGHNKQFHESHSIQIHKYQADALWAQSYVVQYNFLKYVMHDVDSRKRSDVLKKLNPGLMELYRSIEGGLNFP